MKLVLPAILLLAILSGCTKESKNSEESAAQPKSAPVTAASGESAAPAVVATNAAATATPSAPSGTSGLPSGAVPNPGGADLTVDAQGLSKSAVVMKTTRGTIKFRLYAKDAPNTVKRIVELVQQKFYNGLSFHRVVPGFVVQTGDPKSRNKNEAGVGNGGSGQKLKSEFNQRRHVRGTLAMARTSDPDSADSQFYFSLSVFPHLDNNYTVFGLVSDFGEKVGGDDVLNRIHQGDEILDMHIE